MRRSQGVLLPPVHTGRLRRRDLYRSMRTAVLDGVLRPSDQLPSTRQAAADYGVSRGMMEEVYDQLVEEGFLKRAVGRGTFVAPRVAGLVAGLVASATLKRGSPRASRRGLS